MQMTKKKVVEEIMENIEIIQEHIRNVRTAKRFINNRNFGRTEGTQCPMTDRLLELELQEWQKLAMWGLTLNGKGRDRVKAAAHQRFLSDKMYVANYLDRGEHPSRWLTVDEKDFREMAKKAFAPKNDEGDDNNDTLEVARNV